jgi:hypothetical protein
VKDCYESSRNSTKDRLYYRSLHKDRENYSSDAVSGLWFTASNVCSILFSLKIFGKYMFLAKKLMLILADFRKNNICGVKMVSAPR